MDADRFDEIAKALGLSAARRGMVAGLLSGGVASLLANLEAAARRRTRRDDGLSAEKKRKKKCKKCGECRKCKKGKCKPKPNGTPCAGGSCQGGACKLGDEAPPCTDESCPLPPECSQESFDACSGALAEAILDDVEACQPVCADVNSAACQECLEPIAAARMPEAEACIAESCGFPILPSETAGIQATQPSIRPKADSRLTRTCRKACCYIDYQACQESADAKSVICAAAAVVGMVLSGPGGVAAYLACVANYAYSLKECFDRYWCLEGSCNEDDTCCPIGEQACGHTCCPQGTQCCPGRGGVCCSLESHCCPGGGCCNTPDTCCRRESGLFCCPPGAQCMQTGIPCCSNC